jgi:hypothetical protein
MWGKTSKLIRFALTHLPVRAIDTGGNNFNHDLAGCDYGIRHLAKFENLRPAVSFDEGSFH